MKILWLTWKDREHPLTGGAEVVNEELAKCLVAEGHEVTFLVGGFPGGAPTDERLGFKIIRVGSRFSVYWKAYRYYKENLKDWPDLVIDEVNTIPFLAKLYVKQRNFLFIHQLCREIWFYEMPFPLSLIGYLFEPLYLWLLNDRQVITVSDSSKRDLMRYGFKADNISIISEGIELPVAEDLAAIQKYASPTLLAFGSIRSMKRTDHIVRAFEIAKRSIPDLQLIVAGKPHGSFGAKVLAMIQKSAFSDSITCIGFVDETKKIELMQRSHVLAVASVKEGWGLVVTEANSQGTPAVVYNVDGLRDSVRHDETGFITHENSPEGLSWAIAEILKDPAQYARLRENAWQWSKEITFDKSYERCTKIIGADGL